METVLQQRVLQAAGCRLDLGDDNKQRRLLQQGVLRVAGWIFETILELPLYSSTQSLHLPT